MPKAVSPEEKLYVKDEIEKIRKDIKEDLEKASSKTTRTFTILACIIGILTGAGVYGLASRYVDDSIKKSIESIGLAAIRKNAQSCLDYIENKKKEVDESSKIISKIADSAEQQTYNSRTQAFISETQKIQSKKVNLNKPSAMPVEGKFRSNGGVVVLLVSGSGLHREDTGLIRMDVLVDTDRKETATSYVNEKGSHAPFTAFIVIDGLSSGDHTVKLVPGPNTWANNNDLFSVIALELPKFGK